MKEYLKPFADYTALFSKHTVVEKTTLILSESTNSESKEN